MSLATIKKKLSDTHLKIGSETAENWQDYRGPEILRPNGFAMIIAALELINYRPIKNSQC